MKNLDDHSWFTVDSSSGKNTNGDKALASQSSARYVQVLPGAHGPTGS
jgi:hypothetical protein